MDVLLIQLVKKWFYSLQLLSLLLMSEWCSLPGCRSVKLCKARHWTLRHTLSWREAVWMSVSVSSQQSSWPATVLAQTWHTLGNRTSTQYDRKTRRRIKTTNISPPPLHIINPLPILSPLTSFEERIVAQSAVSRCRFVELRPTGLNQRLRLTVAILLLVGCLNEDDLQTV